MPYRSGPGEASHKESYPPPSVKSGRLGGLEQCGNQEEVMESGLKGGAEAIPGPTAGTSPSETLSKNVALEEYGGFERNRP